MIPNLLVFWLASHKLYDGTVISAETNLLVAGSRQIAFEELVESFSMMDSNKFVNDPSLLFEILDLSASKRLNKLDLYRVMVACKMHKGPNDKFANHLDPTKDVETLFNLFAHGNNSIGYLLSTLLPLF